MNAKVTIGITCYNAVATLVQAIESALTQNYPDFEVVVVDDVSSDKSWTIIQEMAQKYPRKIRIFRNETNLGVAGTRNRIIAEAQGNFLVFFDDDDVSLPDRLIKQVTRIVDYERDFARGAPVICHAARLQKYPDGKEFIAPTMGGHVGGMAPHGKDMAARILYNKKIDGGDGSMPTCSQMARLSVYKELGGFDSSFRRMEDTEFNVRLALAGGHFVGIDEPLVIQTMTQASDKRIRDERQYARMLYRKYVEFLQGQGRGTFDIDWVEVKHDYWEGAKVTFILRLLVLFVFHPILSAERLLHALPNRAYNNSIREFYNGRDV